MVPRYESPDIAQIWSNKKKLCLWQKTELAVIKARVNLSMLNGEIWMKISRILESNAIDIDWWLARDKEVGHDLNAFLDERLRFLSTELQPYFHDGLTSYDTEEPAFAKILLESVDLVLNQLKAVVGPLKDMARKYRYTIMNGRTHGQEAELQSFGKRCLTWFVVLREGIKSLSQAKENLKFSKLSGAIGNYRGLKPEVEEEALDILGLKPFYGATQIMPREIYVPIAQAVCQVVQTLDKIATDIRLGARSGRPICQEPFSKKQKGSSAMPHKKNTISSEQLEGMARMAQGYLQMIVANIKTWEERAIEQSSVERVAWPDLFHVAVHSAKTMAKVLKGLVVFPDNMLLEIVDSCGCYAAGEAKEFLRHNGVPHGFSTEDAYRIVQLAAFNAFVPDEDVKSVRQNPPPSFHDAENLLLFFRRRNIQKPVFIQNIIAEGKLKVSDQLEATIETVSSWNVLLKQIFDDIDIRNEWDKIFAPSYLLRGEAKLYKEILGDD